MASSVNIAPRNVPIGDFTRTIDGLPANSEGFTLALTGWDTWPAGPVFSLTIEMSPDGVNFQPWIAATGIEGGPHTRFGVVQTNWNLSGRWPGENDGTGDTMANRRVLRQSSLRLTLSVVQPFTAGLKFDWLRPG